MPQVTIKTGFTGADGSEETLSAYLCDFPDCPETAVEVLGAVRELAASFVVCRPHALASQKKSNGS